MPFNVDIDNRKALVTCATHPKHNLLSLDESDQTNHVSELEQEEFLNPLRHWHEVTPEGIVVQGKYYDRDDHGEQQLAHEDQSEHDWKQRLCQGFVSFIKIVQLVKVQ